MDICACVKSPLHVQTDERRGRNKMGQGPEKSRSKEEGKIPLRTFFEQRTQRTYRFLCTAIHIRIRIIVLTSCKLFTRAKVHIGRIIERSD